MSNKFSRAGNIKKTPAVCHAPPSPPLIITPINRPVKLVAWARWTDLDPAIPPEDRPDVTQQFELQKIDDTPTYRGAGPPNRHHLQLELQLQTSPDLWKITLTLIPTPGTPETSIWNNTRVDPTIPFDTGPLEAIWDPDIDYQKARIME